MIFFVGGHLGGTDNLWGVPQGQIQDFQWNGKGRRACAQPWHKSEVGPLRGKMSCLLALEALGFLDAPPPPLPVFNQGVYVCSFSGRRLKPPGPPPPPGHDLGYWLPWLITKKNTPSDATPTKISPFPRKWPSTAAPNAFEWGRALALPCYLILSLILKHSQAWYKRERGF